jgi:IclR family transcriptional regulator, KDG regulon repressor
MAEISKTTDQALALLERLSGEGPMTAAELATALELNRTVVHRSLTTLHRRGFVTRNGSRYCLGPTLVRIAGHVQPELHAAAAEVMPALTRAIDETTVLHIVDGAQAVVLEQAVSTAHVVRVEHRIGSRHSLLVGASGRALLAFLDSRRATRMVQGAADPGQLRRQLDDIRASGYAISHDELQHGVYGIAAPILENGLAIASLAILVPQSRAGDLEQFAERLMLAARRIGRAVGG